MSIGVAQAWKARKMVAAIYGVLRGFMSIGVAQEPEVLSVPAATRLPQAFADGDSVTSKDIDKILDFFQNADMDQKKPGWGN